MLTTLLQLRCMAQLHVHKLHGTIACAKAAWHNCMCTTCMAQLHVYKLHGMAKAPALSAVTLEDTSPMTTLVIMHMQQQTMAKPEQSIVEPAMSFLVLPREVVGEMPPAVEEGGELCCPLAEMMVPFSTLLCRLCFLERTATHSKQCITARNMVDRQGACCSQSKVRHSNHWMLLPITSNEIQGAEQHQLNINLRLCVLYLAAVVHTSLRCSSSRVLPSVVVSTMSHGCTVSCCYKASINIVLCTVLPCAATCMPHCCQCHAKIIMIATYAGSGKLTLVKQQTQSTKFCATHLWRARSS